MVATFSLHFTAFISNLLHCISMTLHRSSMLLRRSTMLLRPGCPTGCCRDSGRDCTTALRTSLALLRFTESAQQVDRTLPSLEDTLPHFARAAQRLSGESLHCQTGISRFPIRLLRGSE